MRTTPQPGAPWRLLAAAAVTALTLSACGGGSADSDGPAAQRASEADTAQPSNIAHAAAKAASTQPGALIKPVAATSSPVENPGMSAAAAIDGNPNSRWGSTFVDDAWIQFDFGQPTAIGAMKLVWERSYGKEYALQVSDDGQSWAQLRYVMDGKGGTEEFLNLGVLARYIRLQGVARSSQYGYSLFEVEFKTPGSDNTQGGQATAPLRFPPSGQGLVPLPAAPQPLEQVQFTLADGTLVTRFGARAMGRHGRERGEEWNEIGYGPNDTVDAAGQPVDKGPGAHLTFVTQYFKNRTWGMEIIDNSRVAGVTKPTLIVNRYTQVDFLPGDTAFFRAFDRPGVTGYGWMNPGELVDRSAKVCAPTPYPTSAQLVSAGGINGACTLRVKDYPGHGGLGADGLPNGTHVPSRPLVVGDAIEVSPAMFSTREAMAAKGDSGGIRYYSAEWLYVVGRGLTPWYGVQPRLNSAPLPVATLSGGTGSVSYNYSDNGSSMFQQPFNHVGMQNMQRFVEGRRLIHTDFTTGAHSEPGNDPYTPATQLQGTHFNQSMCVACHVNNGRSPAPTRLNQRLDSMSVHAASLGEGGVQQPHPRYGSVVQMNALAAGSGHRQDWGNSVRVARFETREVRLADGTVVELRKPVLGFDGGAPAAYSLRAAPPMIGMGLLEAVPEDDILARARSTPDEDGVQGRPNYVYDPETGAVRLGRFGWKAAKATLRQQAATALLQDMAVTSPVYPSRDCHYGPAACATGPRVAGITESDLASVSNYLALVAVPAQRSLESGFPKGVAPLDEHRVNPAQVAQGSRLFDGMRCTACHTAQMTTGGGHLFAELRNQVIRPYTDLLLHDMGPGLADNFAEGQAQGALWRTAPLWGIGYTDKVMGRGRSADVGYLHDGRARNLTEAILWHGGEADASRRRFEALPRTDREALLAFLRSL